MIAKLRAEHDQLIKALNLLESQFLSLCRGEKPDYSLMRVILVYVQEYLEQVHHPIEDNILSIILKKGREGVYMAQVLIKDHTDLEIITRNLRKIIELLNSGGEYNEDEFKREIYAFMKTQREHLYNEEMIMYPLAKKILSKKEWKKVETMAPKKEAPVFGEGEHSEYEILFREIESRSE